MRSILIKQPTIINEGRSFIADVLIVNGQIMQIGKITQSADYNIIDATGMYLLPGVIDTHVHFREPGLTHKGDICSESKAAVAGGVTSFFDMPNSVPNAVTVEEILNKIKLGSQRSVANYGFYFGATSENRDQIKLALEYGACGITDDGLYFTNSESLLVEQPELLKYILNNTTAVVSIHSEFEKVVMTNLKNALHTFGNNIPVSAHSNIRSEAACVSATELALKIARETTGRLHVLHLSTGKEAQMFESDRDIKNKRITSEVCIHHLWFSEEDYEKLGAKIKWNPSIKAATDKEQLLKALIDDRIDIVSTDHAPHLLAEKERNYSESPGGAPMIQHSLLVMLEFVKQGIISIEKVVEKMCHNPALLFDISKRGFIREGYHADIVIIDPNCKYIVNKSNVLYKCGWSPLENYQFSTSVFCTIVNGQIAYINGCVNEQTKGQQLLFNRAVL
jgi:dihydroorotase